MARKLKTYQTSLGFFDLAIAAPSMKAALEAWGADGNLFHQGAAKESDHADVIAATMAKPGVVLRRPVGSDGSFGEHAELPTNLGGVERPTKAARRSKGPKAKEPASRPVDKVAERKAALAFEKEQKRRERERASEEAARQKERERRQKAVDKAQAALEKTEREMQEGPRPSKPRWTLLRRDRKLKTPTGPRRRSDWRPRCGAREVRSPGFASNNALCGSLTRSFGRALGAGIPDRAKNLRDGSSSCLRRKSRRRILVGNVECALAGMRIGALLHPAVLFALSKGANFPQHFDSPSLECAGRWPSLVSHHHRESPSSGMNPQTIQLFRFGR
jgi:hypothetical protein